MNLPRPSSAAAHWDLEPRTVFLNHGSFGACPHAALAAQNELRRQLESEPVRFFVESYRPLMDTARRTLGEFLGCDWTSLAPMPNASHAVATVLRHLEDTELLRPGDEILTNDHEYPACQNILRATAARTGSKVVAASLPFPCESACQLESAIVEAVTPRTRLVLLSHVTSPSALVLPVESLVPKLRAMGILTLVDGAHAPGMVDALNLGSLRPDFYTANCHKWLCTPKGSAFLYVDPAHQRDFRPLVLSNYAEKPIPDRTQFLTEFDYLGTTDPTAFMSIPASLRVMGDIARDFLALPADTADRAAWSSIMLRNHALVLEARDLLCGELGMDAPAPERVVGSIATLILPPHPPERQARLRQRPSKYHDALQDALISRHRIQVPVWSVEGRPHRTLRISAQLYNTSEQYEYLARALVEELDRERAL